VTQPLLFVSYSQKDDDGDNLVLRVFTHLRVLRTHFPGLVVWVDKDIRAGAVWSAEIDEALDAAAVAVLLVSANFANSDFIQNKELPRLLARHREGTLRLFPISLRPCAAPPEVEALQMRPRGDTALSKIDDQRPSDVDGALKEIVNELKGVLGEALGPSAGAPVSAGVAAAGDLDHARCIALLTKTLFASGPSELYVPLASRLVRQVQRHANVPVDLLFDAVRFFIEFHLFKSEDPSLPAALEASLDRKHPLATQLRNNGRTGRFATVTEVGSRFFNLTNEHADVWKRYFDAVVAAGAAGQSDVASLTSIKSAVGYIAPQHLVGGLLSRFDNDWREVLHVYERSTPNPGHKLGAFESLQASQWNCWLMWGPSIPVCACPQWSGLCALQYGYGDESNSLPVIDTRATEGLGELEPIVSELRAEGRSAKFGRLTARLRWGPYFLRSQYEVSDEPGTDTGIQIIDPDAVDEDTEPPAGTGQRGAAPAQAAIYAAEGGDGPRAGNGLVLDLERIDALLPVTRVYFSAYLWVMFLVATGPETETGPRLLSGHPCPAWDDDDSTRKRHVIDGRFWQDLLPVFVHANVGDPDALAFQKQVLAENAIELLRQVWTRRTELFHPDGVKAGLRFYLVCASDHSGCGEEPRLVPRDALIELLRARLSREPDKEFVEAVMLPRAAGGHGLDGLEGYFSACHLPELIGWYYDYVVEESRRRHAGRRSARVPRPDHRA